MLAKFVILCFITLLNSVNISGSISSEIWLQKTSSFVSETIIQGFQGCKLYIVFGNFKKLESKTSQSWLTLFEDITSHKNLQTYSGGIINLQLNGNETNNQIISIARPARIISTESCSATFLLLPSMIKEYDESILTQQLTRPLLNPPTFKNKDKFVIISKEENLASLQGSKLITSIKYLMIITDGQNGQSVLSHHFCPYCPKGPIQTKEVEVYSEISQYFPDFQKFYYGSTLKLSVSNKVPVLLEIKKGTMNENRVKRGVYAFVLLHLIQKLNFTYDLIIASGGGSTGHQLPDKTWVGTVGDTFNGLVDFGFMADVTYQRFAVVELCATINFAYLGFGTGPPVRIYTWKAIFWPFSMSMWAGMIISTILSAVTASILLKYCYFGPPTTPAPTPQLMNSWGIMPITQYFSKVLIEQGEDCPSRSNTTRVFFGFWLLFAMVATTAYKSKIVSFMMFPVVDKVPNSFEQLVKSKYDINFHYFGNVAFNLFKTSTSPTFVSIYQRMKKEPDPLECLKSTMTSKSACILFQVTYDLMRYRHLSDRLGNSPVRFSPHYGFMYTPGVIHEKKAALSSNFKSVIRNAMEMGLLQHWKKIDLHQILRDKVAAEQAAKKANGEANQILETTEENDDDVLHLINLVGSFTVFGFGSLIALVVFFGEIIYNRYRLLLEHRKNIAAIIYQAALNRKSNRNPMIEVLSLKEIGTAPVLIDMQHNKI